MLAPVINVSVPQIPILKEVKSQEWLGHNRVRIEIDVERLACLLRSGPLHAAEIRCLDCVSKKCVQKIVLKNLLCSGMREGVAD